MKRKIINITYEMFLFYLNYYLIQHGFRPNMSKLKYLMSNYNEKIKHLK